MVFSFISCSTLVKKRQEVPNKKNNKPHRTFTKIRISYKENGNIRFFIDSPIMEEYSFYTLFPNGIKLFLFYEGKKKYIYLSANWVKLTKEIFYNFKGQVIVMNSNGDFLKTEEIFWNKKSRKIFNNIPTIIYCNDGILLHAKNGIEASEDLKKINIKNISGIIPIE
ncbi:hypothetical protein [Blattabacterium cuenoti]|uniref:hypothetical protein n=1 Tax=Blattabacterium cuenoti TaxID=1653831 RepID=UPI001EECCCC6|nr:hypothetical protein [Blattabacterium cuenoti]